MANDNKKISFLPQEMKEKEEKELKKRKREFVDESEMHIPTEESQKNKWSTPLKQESVQEKKKDLSFLRKIFGTPEEREKRRLQKKEEKQKKKEAKDEEKKKKAQEKQMKQEKELKKKEEAVKQLKKEVLNKKEKTPRKEKNKEQKALSKEPPPKKEAGMRVSLIPEEILHPLKLRFSRALLIFILTQIVIIIILSFGYLWMVWQESKLTTQEQGINQQIGSVDRQIKDYTEGSEMAREVQQKINIFQELLTRHIYWTKFLSLLEKNTIPEVYYTSIAADASGGVVLSAKGSSYTAAARQLVAMKEATDFVDSVAIASVVGETVEESGVGQVSFDINIQLAEGVFLKP